jgi:L-alanine-DL-glutamate epimerase-like enolase superfamily enzyme
MNVAATIDNWPFSRPFRIARGEMLALDVVLVELTTKDGVRGRGEAAGVDYAGETAQSILAQIEWVSRRINSTTTRYDLMELLPAGGARNALDCALWDVEAKRSGIPAWRSAGLFDNASVVSAFTIGIGSEAETREKARELRDWPLIKIKVDANDPMAAINIVAEEAPSASFIVDANQAWTIYQLNAFAPELAERKVALIEQPLKAGTDEALRKYRGLVPLAADESCVDRSSLPSLKGLYDVINIKLDKTGGLTEALLLSAAARDEGFKIMVGCMAGTSLAMAPAAIIAQNAEFVDLDGPLLHRDDRPHGLTYDGGRMSFPTSALWG